MSEIKNRFDKKGARDMDKIAKTLFAPVYPVIAENLIRKLGITTGTCVDIGSGPASLAIAVAQRSDLSVIALDYSDDMHEAAARNINEAGLSDRICLICADVHAIPLDDDSADFIISRGSMYFWDDICTAFREIYRILKPAAGPISGPDLGTLSCRTKYSPQRSKRIQTGRNLAEKYSHPGMWSGSAPCSMKSECQSMRSFLGTRDSGL